MNTAMLSMAYHQLPGYQIAGIADLDESEARDMCGFSELDVPVFADYFAAEEADKAGAVVLETGRKLVVGYILRRHPFWQRLMVNFTLLRYLFKGGRYYYLHGFSRSR